LTDAIGEVLMDIEAVGRVGLTGMKGRAGRGVAHAIGARTSFDEERVAAILGGALLTWWCYQSVKLIREVVKAARASTGPALQSSEPNHPPDAS
jgi:hypothetical protein